MNRIEICVVVDDVPHHPSTLDVADRVEQMLTAEGLNPRIRYVDSPEDEDPDAPAPIPEAEVAAALGDDEDEDESLLAAAMESESREPRLAPFIVDRIDWEALREQKDWLAEYAGGSLPLGAGATAAAQGLLGLIDGLQDVAANILGDIPVYGEPYGDDEPTNPNTLDNLIDYLTQLRDDHTPGSTPVYLTDVEGELAPGEDTPEGFITLEGWWDR